MSYLSAVSKIMFNTEIVSENDILEANSFFFENEPHLFCIDKSFPI